MGRKRRAAGAGANLPNLREHANKTASNFIIHGSSKTIKERKRIYLTFIKHLLYARNCINYFTYITPKPIFSLTPRNTMK